MQPAGGRASQRLPGSGRRRPTQLPRLGLSIAGYQDIDLTGGAVPPTPFYARPRPMMMAAMAAPIATPDAQNVTRTVAADVFLRVAAAAQSQNH